jgi:hypothetical protein
MGMLGSLGLPCLNLLRAKQLKEVLFPKSTKQMISGKMILVLGKSLHKRKKCGSLVKVKGMSLARGGLLYP